MAAVITASGALILSTVYISQKFLDQFIKEEGYGRLKRFFFPKKKYENRLSQIISSTIVEYKTQTEQQSRMGTPIYFYESEALVEKLSLYVLYRTKYTEEEINILFDSYPNIIRPKKSETDLFLKLFIKNVLKDHELKKLHILERYQEEIFNISADVKAVKVNLDEVVEILIKDKIGTKQKNNLTSDLLKIFIDTDKKDFIDLNRTFENFESDDLYFSFEEKNFNIYEIINKNTGIAIIGNPGSGKSTEILNLAYSLWKDHSNELIPVFRKMNNFTSSDSINDYLNFDLISEFSNLIFILDGIDEIVDVNDFISKLQTFKREHNLRNRNYKYLISCRSNIFNDFSSQLNGLETYKLSELKLNQSQKLLESLTQSNFDLEDLYLYSQNNIFLKNPYQLKIVANYYNNQGYLETNTAKLWDTYVTDRIENDKSDKFQKKTVSIPILKKNLKKTALTHELMQKSSFDEESVLKIIDSNHKELADFIHSSLIEFNPARRAYFFEHKNIQEYFSAKVLEGLPFDLTKKIICISGTNSIHPSYTNTVTFLLNLTPLDNSNYREFIEWITSHNPELLFKADSDRISELKEPVFQNFFYRTCAETTIWIGQISNINISDIAQFADHLKNYEYLLKYVIDPSAHFRVRISALEIIREFKHLNREELLVNFFNILESETESLNIKSEVIRSICTIGYQKTDKTIIPQIIKLFDTETDNSINSRILGLIDESDQIDQSIDYLLKEFDYAFKIKLRKIEENILLGNDWKLKVILLKLENPKNFILLASKLLLNNQRDFSENYPERLIDRIKELMAHSPEIIIELISRIINDSGDNSLFDRKNFLSKMVIQLELQEKVFQNIFKKETFQDLKWFLSEISTEETIQYFIQNWKTILQGDTTQLENFRNILNYDHHYSLSGKLQDALLQQNVELKSLLPTREEAKEKQKTEQEEAQNEFDELFDPTLAIKSISDFFKETHSKRLTKVEVYELERIFYNNHDNSFKRLPKALQLLQYLARKDDLLTVETITSRINNLRDYIFFIDSEISHIISDRNYLKVKINEPQRIIFQDWLKELSESLNFKNLIEHTSSTSYRLPNIDSKLQYDIHQLIIKYYCHDNFQISLSKDFLLNTIEFFEIENYEKDKQFERFLDSINDESAVKKQITENLNKQLFLSVYNRHAKYALEKGFREVFQIIENHLLSDDSIYSENELLLLFVQINGNSILTKMHHNIQSRSCWTAIELLMKSEPSQDEKELYIQKAKEYLALGQKDFIKNALNVLMIMNDPFAIAFLHGNIDEHFSWIGSINQANYLNYNVVLEEDLLYIKDVFNFIYAKDAQTDKFRFHYLSEFFYSYLYNISKNEPYYKQLTIVLNEIRVSLSETDDHELFYINSIINNCSKSYISTKSVPMSFKDALEKVNELMS